MYPKYDVIICTNVYNRTHTLASYMEAFLSNTKKETRYHIYFIANYDEMWSKGTALDEIRYDLDMVDWVKFGLTAFDGKTMYDVMSTPNIGLSGYNLGIELGKTLNCPVLCMNDDTLVPKGWEKLLEMPKTAVLEGKEVQIDPSKVGIIGPTYTNCGAMTHQKYNPTETGYLQCDFTVGHCQLVTLNAIKKGFRYDSEKCLGFGPYDIAASVINCSLELNSFVCKGLPFDFPESKESHFHNGSHEKFDAKLTPIWKDMQSRLEAFQKDIHVAKYGHNKWYF